ncbi:hypothetical protein LWI29_028454 [Acer saccharum]|uniref:Uncharacterized protein n=1 Tax=Acer saccharum TaxID=4024 RepID=A0AA39VLN5_ACESA|nr:hypothetical protein LWI29_028454 [Acer saccharum]
MVTANLLNSSTSVILVSVSRLSSLSSGLGLAHLSLVCMPGSGLCRLTGRAQVFRLSPSGLDCLGRCRMLVVGETGSSTDLVLPRTDIYLGSLNPMSIADFQGHVVLSQDEGVEIVGYKAMTSFWHCGILSKELSDSLYDHGYILHSLLKEKEEEKQFPCIQYLVLNSICHMKLPQALHNLDFLGRICISNCSELVSFPEATLPSLLRAIDIESCKALQYLPNTWMDCTSMCWESLDVPSKKAVISF